MSTTDTNTLTTISPGSSWYPSSFLATHYLDSLDLSAAFPDSTTRSVLKLYANGDANFAGDIFLEAGAIRSANTNVIQCMDADQDIISFRKSTQEGQEVLRIERSGSISGAYEQPLRWKSRQATAVEDTAVSYVTLELESVPRYLASGLDDQAVLEVTAGGTMPNRLFSIFGKPSAGVTLDVTDGSVARPAVLRASAVTVTASADKAVLNITSGNTTTPTLSANTTTGGVWSISNLTVAVNTLELTPAASANAVLKLSAQPGRLAKIQAYVNNLQDNLAVEANSLILVATGAHAVLKVSAPNAKLAKLQAYVNNVQDDLTVEANTLILSPLSTAHAALKLSAGTGKLAKIQAYVNSALADLMVDANTIQVTSAAGHDAALTLNAPSGYTNRIQSVAGSGRGDFIAEANTVRIESSSADAVLVLYAPTSYAPKIKAYSAGAISDAEFDVNKLTLKSLTGIASTLRLESASGSATLNLYPGTGSPREWKVEARTDSTLALVDVTDTVDIGVFDYDATASGGSLSIACLTLGATRPSAANGRMYFDPATNKLWVYCYSGGAAWRSITF